MGEDKYSFYSELGMDIDEMPISDEYKKKLDLIEQKKNAKRAEDKVKHANHSKEVDFKEGDIIEIKYDIYNLTIAANMTKNCSPAHLIFCIRQCFLVFFIQVMMAYFFSADYLDMTRFQPFLTELTILRIICAMFLQLTLRGEFNKGVMMLMFLKRMRQSGRHAKGRFINIMICSLQCLSSLITYACLIINLG